MWSKSLTDTFINNVFYNLYIFKNIILKAGTIYNITNDTYIINISL